MTIYLTSVAQKDETLARSVWKDDTVQPITTAMMVRASQASLGSSGVCVSERLSKDAKLAAAALARSLFSRPKGRGPARGRRGHTMAVEALVPPDAARVATVYTNAPERRRGAVLADLCTLLCPHACPLRRTSRKGALCTRPSIAARPKSAFCSSASPKTAVWLVRGS